MSYNILLIEDNAEMAENISSILELANYNVTHAPNGKVGVDMGQQLSWAGFGLRFLFAVLLVFLTFNPSGYSYYHWVKHVLPGVNPYVVLADADLAHAARLCATARLINGGQSCISAKRLIVVEKVIDEFSRLLVAEVAA